MSAIDWTTDTSLVDMAEVPCTSYYGGIMCQVMAYEIEIPTGKILNSISPSQFKQRWQGSMAWDFRIPDAAEYQPE